MSGSSSSGIPCSPVLDLNLMQNDSQRELAIRVNSAFEHHLPDEILEALRAIPVNLMACKEVASNHSAIFKEIRQALALVGITTPEVGTSGSIIAKRVMGAIYVNDDRRRAFGSFDQSHADALRERREGVDNSLEQQSAPPPLPEQGEEDVAGSSQVFSPRQMSALTQLISAAIIDANNHNRRLQNDIHTPPHSPSRHLLPQRTGQNTSARRDSTEGERERADFPPPSPSYHQRENKRRATKAFRTHYDHKNQFGGKSEEDLRTHVTDFLDMCKEHDIPNEDFCAFFKISLRGDARHFFNAQTEVNKHSWKSMDELFTDRYASPTIQAEISQKLDTLSYRLIRAKSDDDHSALDMLIDRINTLVPMAKPKDRDDEAKVRFLRRACEDTDFYFRAIARLPVQPTFPKFLNGLSTALREITQRNRALARSGIADKQVTTDGLLTTDGVFRTSKWDSHTKEQPAQGINFEEAFFTGQRRFARDPKNNDRKFNSNSYGSQKYGQNRSFSNNSSRPRMLCFNCERDDCALSRCNSPYDVSRITKNMAEWKKRKGINVGHRSVNVVEIMNLSANSAELNDILLAERLAEDLPEMSPLSNVAHDQERELTDATSTVNPMHSMHERLQNQATSSMTQSDSTAYNQSRQDDLQFDDFQQSINFVDNDAVDVGQQTHQADPEVFYIGINASSLSGRLGKTYPHTEFMGACLDTGAAQSVIGTGQAKAYCAFSGLPYKIHPSSVNFRFGDGSYPSIGKLSIRFPTATEAYIPLSVDVINADIPLLIGLNFLRREGLLANYLTDKLESYPFGWSLPLSYKLGHIFLAWPQSAIHFTRSELRRLHLHFLHPSSDKLFQLLKRARPDDADGSVKSMLEKISESCSTCQEFKGTPLRFKASIPPEKVIFNHEIAIDLMWLENVPILHVVDTHTNFQAATVIRSKSAQDIWYAFIECWASLYIGYPRIIRLDQEAGFTAEAFKSLATAHGITLQFSGITSHNSLGAGETYHAPLRRVFSVLRNNYTTLHPEVALAYAVKAINDTVGPDGLVPTMLVFGAMPSFPVLNTNLPEQKNRMEALQSARKEAASIVAEQRLKRALSAKLPPSARFTVRPGESVRVFDEKLKRWVSGYTVVRVCDKQVWVTDGKRLTQRSITHVLPAHINLEDDDFDHMLASFLQFRSGGPPGVLLTEVFKPQDPRAYCQDAMKAKEDEIAGLLQRGVFTTTPKEDVGRTANVLGTRFVMAIKNKGTEKQKYKARLVVQGHTDTEKNVLVHASTALRQHSIRLIVAIAAIMDLSLWCQDITQAYLQSEAPLRREVYLRPTPDMSIRPGVLLKLNKPLYGLSDAGDYWNDTMNNHLRRDLDMLPTTGDLSFFYKRGGNKLEGVIGTYVDDIIGAGTMKFVSQSMRTEKRFESKTRQSGSFVFAGIAIERDGDGYLMHQHEFAMKIAQLSKDCSYDEYRSKRHELAWLVHTRPDISAAVALAAQVTAEKFSPDKVKMLNEAIGRARDNSRRGLKQYPLDLQSLRMVIHADSSFANLEDHGTQLGYIVMLTDDTKRFNVLHYSSFKCKRVVRSVLGGETYAFADAFDMGYLLRHDLKAMLGVSIPITMITDSESLFRVIVKSTTTTEKRLMIDVRAAREAYDRGEISNVALVSSAHNMADALTKVSKVGLLEDAVDRGMLDAPVKQWIIRQSPNLSG